MQEKKAEPERERQHHANGDIATAQFLSKHAHRKAAQHSEADETP